MADRGYGNRAKVPAVEAPWMIAGGDPNRAGSDGIGSVRHRRHRSAPGVPDLWLSIRQREAVDDQAGSRDLNQISRGCDHRLQQRRSAIRAVAS